jgi:aminoglycoside/choline kinase family phosphotransferase
MRPGLAQYDVASLVFDPYIDLQPNEREELIAYYRDAQLRSGQDAGAHDFARILRLCAMQRLMQALGAYGYLGLVKRHKSFLGHIPAALKSLRAVVATIDGLAPLKSFLAGVA